MMQSASYRIIFTLILLWLGHFLVDFMIGIWPVYKTMAHLDLAYAGLISAVAAFLGEGMQIVFGPLSDRGHQKKLIIGGVLAACACAFVAYTTHYFGLFLLFFLTCIGSGAFHPAAVGVVDGLTAHRKGLFITLFASGGSVGLAVSQLTFSEAYLWFNGHTSFLIVPAILLAAVLMLYPLIKPSAPSKDTSKSSVSFTKLFGLLRDPSLRLLYLGQVSNLSLYWALIFFLPDILVQRNYDAWICFGGAHLFLIMGAATMMVPAGLLADRYQPKNVLIAGALGALSLMTLFLCSPLMATTPLLMTVFFLGAMLGLLNPVIISYGTRLMPSAPGSVSALLMGFAWCVSEGVGQGGGGLLSKLFEDQAAAKALAILSLNLVICLYCFTKLAKVPSPSLGRECSNAS